VETGNVIFLYIIFECLFFAHSHWFTKYLSITQYAEEDIPEARFSYDISPMAVVISRKGKHWYEFVTSICALIGGTFTVVGLLSGFLNLIFKSKKL
jgi:hypothetical protein